MERQRRPSTAAVRTQTANRGTGSRVCRRRCYDRVGAAAQRDGQLCFDRWPARRMAGELRASCCLSRSVSSQHCGHRTDCGDSRPTGFGRAGGSFWLRLDYHVRYLHHAGRRSCGSAFDRGQRSGSDYCCGRHLHSSRAACYGYGLSSCSRRSGSDLPDGQRMAALLSR